jgi:hypothetical protein
LIRRNLFCIHHQEEEERRRHSQPNKEHNKLEAETKAREKLRAATAGTSLPDLEMATTEAENNNLPGHEIEAARIPPKQKERAPAALNPAQTIPELEDATGEAERNHLAQQFIDPAKQRLETTTQAEAERKRMSKPAKSHAELEAQPKAREELTKAMPGQSTPDLATAIETAEQNSAGADMTARAKELLERTKTAQERQADQEHQRREEEEERRRPSQPNKERNKPEAETKARENPRAATPGRSLHDLETAITEAEKNNPPGHEIKAARKFLKQKERAPAVLNPAQTIPELEDAAGEAERNHLPQQLIDLANLRPETTTHAEAERKRMSKPAKSRAEAEAQLKAPEVLMTAMFEQSTPDLVSAIETAEQNRAGADTTARAKELLETMKAPPGRQAEKEHDEEERRRRPSQPTKDQNKPQEETKASAPPC